jgi:hypothetical protein
MAVAKRPSRSRSFSVQSVPTKEAARLEMARARLPHA